jgi:FMN phosphatase YigB (HAD superfamily)
MSATIRDDFTIEAVLFDWRGTLFTDETELEWIRNAANSIGRRLDDDQIIEILERGEAVLREKHAIRDALNRCDTSTEAHREATLNWLHAADLDDDLALAIWARDGVPEASFPFDDTEPVLRTLHHNAIRIAVVSDIHYDIRDHFRNHALDDYIDAYVLSYQLGCQKPDPEMFERALDALEVPANRALMVGDRASHDGGAAALGIATLILPGPFTGGDTSPRGLHAALRLVQPAR